MSGHPVSVAVVFTDLVGSTALASRVGPEAAERLRREHFALLRVAIDRHGGSEVKNLGDGLMIVFDRSSAAVAASVAMQQLIDRGNRTSVDGEVLAIRVGVAAGEADADDSGDVFGPPVVEAARLCADAEGDQILVTDVVRTLTGARGGFAFDPLGERTLRGLPDPVRVWAVSWEPLDAVVDTTSAVPLPNRLATAGAIVAGRVEELARLGDAWKHAVVGACRGVVVGGEAGIGKTTLLARFAQTVSADGGAVSYGRCDEDLAIAYQPWGESLQHLAAHLPDDVLDAHVAARGTTLARLVPALGRTASGAGSSGSDDGGTERHLLFAAVVDLLDRAAAITPVLLVLDDFHWADRPTTQLLRHVLADDDLRGVAIVVTYRPTDIDAAHPMTETLAALRRIDGTDFIDLSGLDDRELLELLGAIAGHDLPDEALALRDALSAETDGNPFFTLEILRHLSETGTLRQDADGRWAATIDLRVTGLPVSVRQVVGQRVARLGEATERVPLGAALAPWPRRAVPLADRRPVARSPAGR